MLVRDAYDEFLMAQRNNSKQTQEWYKRRIGAFVEWCEQNRTDLEQIDPRVLRRYLDYLSTRPCKGRGRSPSDGLASRTQYGHAKAVKTFLTWCAGEAWLQEKISDKATRGVKLPRVEEKIIEIFTDEHIKALFDACAKEYDDKLVARDKAILAVLLDTGIRAGELVALCLDDLFLKGESPFLRVNGKGRKQREVGLGLDARKLLNVYLLRYRKPGAAERHVFVSRFNKPLTVGGLGILMDRLARWASIQGVRASPHTFRHTYAITYLKLGIGDVFRLSRLLGHTQIAVTMQYLKAFQAMDARQSSQSVFDARGKKK